MKGRDPRPQDIHLALTQAVLRSDPAGCRPHAHDLEESALTRPPGRDPLDAALRLAQCAGGVRTEACGGLVGTVAGGTALREHASSLGVDGVAVGRAGA